MKHKILHWILLLILIMAGGAYAQEKAAAPTADTIQVKGLIIIKGKDARGKNTYKFYHDTAYARAKLAKNLHTKWFVVDVGFNNYIDRSDYRGAYAEALDVRNSYYSSPNASYGYSGTGLNAFAPRAASAPLTPDEFKLITGKSVNVNIWIIQQRLNIYKHKLNVIYALGVEMNNYRYARNITYVPGYPTKIIRDTVNFSKNKLFAEYLSVPVMLNFNSNPARPGRSFELSVGVMGGYLVKSRTKQISEERGKIKRTDDFNLNKWRFGLTSELAYGPVKLYSNFALTPLHDYGLEQYPFSIGIRFNGF
ncbi:outer membrane beta-barrel protein [Chitinophaga japonensis]|uniref:Outer membrane protein with beta-barrel domain n=1 Tax=Chitinophaga japonensis TaxID=104662 RepID=A0A562TEJ0_CHIJA|nr:outer membrane beta-barrel protein [Chitinophaga japonensis]TWI91895.1 outer membrane protein with beta-barrel domain [Chitinophaga japonensis]